MNQLTLEWTESGRVITQTLSDRQPSKNPGTIRIGRDPAKCDIVLTHPTVSGLHVEIFFNPQQNNFWVRNLRPSNPPLVDRQPLNSGELPLYPNSTLHLGEMILKILAVSVPFPILPPTVLIEPKASPPQPISPTVPPKIYGLQCPRCDRISPYERLDLGCPWCGTSLAAAASVVMPPQ